MAALAPVASKLGKLIPMLSSDRDGEVIAAVRAIGRTLSAAGLDWHALAQAVEHPPVRYIKLEPPAPDLSAVKNPTPDAWRATAKWCAARADTLGPKEREFVLDLNGRLASRQREPTEKQAAWLEAIAAKLRRASQ